MDNYSVQLHNFSLYNGDCNQVLPSLISEKFDMIFADPPYFLSQGNRTVSINGRYVNFDKGEWDRTRPVDQVHDFNIKWLTACRKVLKKNGTIWVCGTYHNIFDIATCLQELSFKILNVVVWHKSDPPETFSQERLNFSAEYIIWARYEEKTKHFFNYDLMKSINGGKQMPDVWQLPSVGAWEKRCGKHPTQKPLALLEELVKTYTNEGDLVVDSCMGSNTTGLACLNLNRRYIGIEKDDEIYEIAKQRIRL
jgi:site-specific DNA-methyltransferase (adenine-specific)